MWQDWQQERLAVSSNVACYFGIVSGTKSMDVLGTEGERAKCQARVQKSRNQSPPKKSFGEGRKKAAEHRRGAFDNLEMRRLKTAMQPGAVGWILVKSLAASLATNGWTGDDALTSEIFNRGVTDCGIDASKILDHTSDIASGYSLNTDHVVSADDCDNDATEREY